VEQVPRLHPAMGALVHLARVLLEDDALARAEGRQVNHRVVLLRDLAQEEVPVLLQLKVDVALGTSQGVEVALHVFRVRLVAEEAMFTAQWHAVLISQARPAAYDSKAPLVTGGGVAAPAWLPYPGVWP